jgi:glycosyltransferase involved in cell wall biosynthesis
MMSVVLPATERTPWDHDQGDAVWRYERPDGPLEIRVTVVIPARNEARNLPIVAATLPPRLHEVIIVDGHSTDDTIAVAETCHPRVRVLQQEKTGKGDALNVGFRAATGDVVVMLDADGSMDGAEIARYVDAMADGADFVKGSRLLLGGGSEDLTVLRRAGNAALRGCVNVLYGTKHSDLCYGYMGFWTKHRETLFVTCDGFEVETHLVIKAARAGFSTVEVPSFERNRVHGSSNLNVVRDGIRVMRTVIGHRYGIGVPR